MNFITVTHETQNNTLEVTWLTATDESVQRTKCVSYSPEQKAELLADLGADADKYILMAGW